SVVQHRQRRAFEGDHIDPVLPKHPKQLRGAMKKELILAPDTVVVVPEAFQSRVSGPLAVQVPVEQRKQSVRSCIEVIDVRSRPPLLPRLKRGTAVQE